MEAKMTGKSNHKIILFAIGIALAFLLGVFALHVTADEASTAPKLEIYARTLEVNDSVDLVFAVRANTLSRSDVKLLIWTTPRTDSYTVGTQQATLSSNETLMIDDVECYIFTYRGFSAKNMADDVYVKAYSQSTETYSELDKYSVLQYAHNKFGNGAAAFNGSNLDEVITTMLQYGAATQKYFNYRTDRLADAAYSQITVKGGCITADLSCQGLYQSGNSITLQAYPADETGVPFSHWENSAGVKISEETKCTITVGETDEAYTAIYQNEATYLITVSGGTIADTQASSERYTKDTVVTINAPETTEITFRKNPATAAFAYWTDSKGQILSESRSLNITVAEADETYTANYSYAYEYFDFILLDNGTYAVKRSESITLKPDTVIIPSFYNNTAVTKIAESSNINATTVYIPHSIIEIGDYAFQNCDKLNKISIPSSVQTIGAFAFQACDNLSNASFETTAGWHYESSGQYHPIIDDLTNSQTNPNTLYSYAEYKLHLMQVK